MELYTPLFSSPTGDFSHSQPCMLVVSFTGSWTAGSNELVVESISSGNIELNYGIFGNDIPEDTTITAFNTAAQFRGSVQFGSTTITVTQMISGTIGLGQSLSGNGIYSNYTIVAFGSGSGGLGTYTMSQSGYDPDNNWVDELYTATSTGGVGKYTLSKALVVAGSALIRQTNSSFDCSLDWDEINKLLKVTYSVSISAGAVEMALPIVNGSNAVQMPSSGIPNQSTGWLRFTKANSGLSFLVDVTFPCRGICSAVMTSALQKAGYPVGYTLSISTHDDSVFATGDSLQIVLNGFDRIADGSVYDSKFVATFSSGSNVITVVSVSQGYVADGQFLSLNGISSSAKIIKGLTGIGLAGTYEISETTTYTEEGCNVLSRWSSGSSSIDVTDVFSGIVRVGQLITGDGIPQTTVITGQTAGDANFSATYRVSGGAEISVQSLISGTIAMGQIVSGAGIVSGTTIDSLISGNRYAISAAPEEVNAWSGTGNWTGTTLTVVSVTSGTVAVNTYPTGTGIDAGTYISASGTGQGGVGTYTLSQTVTTVVSGAESITATVNSWTSEVLTQAGGGVGTYSVSSVNADPVFSVVNEPPTFSATWSITDGLSLTVVSVGTGTIVAGMSIYAPSSGAVLSGTEIVAQVSGSTGGVGVYTLSKTPQVAFEAPLAFISGQNVISHGQFVKGAGSQSDDYAYRWDQTSQTLDIDSIEASFTGSISSSFQATMAGTWNNGILTIDGEGDGLVTVGSTISGGGLTSGTTVLNFLTGSGGIGTYTISDTSTNLGSVVLTFQSTVLVVTSVNYGYIGIGNQISGTGIVEGTIIASQVTGTPGDVGTYMLGYRVQTSDIGSSTMSSFPESSTSVTIPISRSTNLYAPPDGIRNNEAARTYYLNLQSAGAGNYVSVPVLLDPIGKVLTSVLSFFPVTVNSRVSLSATFSFADDLAVGDVIRITLPGMQVPSGLVMMDSSVYDNSKFSFSGVSFSTERPAYILLLCLVNITNNVEHRIYANSTSLISTRRERIDESINTPSIAVIPGNDASPLATSYFVNSTRLGGLRDATISFTEQTFINATTNTTFILFTINGAFNFDCSIDIGSNLSIVLPGIVGATRNHIIRWSATNSNTQLSTLYKTIGRWDSDITTLMIPSPNSTVSGQVTISVSSINLGRSTTISYRNDPRNTITVTSLTCPISSTPIISSDSVGFKTFLIGFSNPVINATTSVTLDFTTAVELPAYGVLSIKLSNCTFGNGTGFTSWYGRDLGGSNSDLFDHVYVVELDSNMDMIVTLRPNINLIVDQLYSLVIPATAAITLPTNGYRSTTNFMVQWNSTIFDHLLAPTWHPTMSPQPNPTASPTFLPTVAPTFAPTANEETVAPTMSPTAAPTNAPRTGISFSGKAQSVQSVGYFIDNSVVLGKPYAGETTNLTLSFTLPYTLRVGDTVSFTLPGFTKTSIGTSLYLGGPMASYFAATWDATTSTITLSILYDVSADVNAMVEISEAEGIVVTSLGIASPNI